MEIQLKASLKTTIFLKSKVKSRRPLLGALEVSDSIFFMIGDENLGFYPTFPSLFSELPQHLRAMLFHNLNTGFNTLERKVNQSLVIYEQIENRTLSHWKKVESY